MIRIPDDPLTAAAIGFLSVAISRPFLGFLYRRSRRLLIQWRTR